MSYLDHIRACNRLDLSDQLRFKVDGHGYGYVSRARAAVLAKHKDVFAVGAQNVTFAPALRTPAARSAAMAEMTPALVATGLFGKQRRELYPAKRRWAEPEAFTIDRGLVSAFGLRAFGVHVNGIAGTADHLWIATRALDRELAPGKLDNMVAGGQPAALSLTENLVKECAEEADLPAELARACRPVGAVSYAFSQSGGVKIDTLFCYDLVVPPGVTPRNTDGEVASFARTPVAEVLALVRDTDRFKFNVNLVILDFALRHSLLDPDREPDYERILAGLQRRPSPELDGFILE
jgi:hypothetical protein